MLYELAVVAKVEAGEKGTEAMRQAVAEAVKSHAGEVLVDDDWGRLNFPCPTPGGAGAGHFLYFIYRSNSIGINEELNRRLRINENAMRYLLVKISDRDGDAANIIKNLKLPYSKKYPGSVADEDGEEEGMEKDRRQFSRRKSCWFTASKIKADWKDPKTFSWLINEFGKISPARISGVSRKHQRFATTAIKRARQLGMVSHVSNRLAE